MTELEARSMWHQLIQALDYLHDINVTHRDIKLENIIVCRDRKTIKLIDFGFSVCVGPSRKLKIFCGTPSYMSP